LYRAAADQRDISGQYALATLYSVGRGVPLDYVSAYVFYGLAASRGDDRSAHELKSLRKRMTPRQLEQAQAQLASHQTPHAPAEAAGLVPLPDDK